MPKVSVLMTVYDRPPLVLSRVLDNVVRSAFGDPDCQVVVVDDGSTVEYPDYEHQKIQWVRIEKDPDCYNIDGTNNPARAWNTALDHASGDIIISMASDCIIPKRGVGAAVERALLGEFYQTRVVNSTGEEFLGSSRLTPYGWFMAWDRRVNDLRWDENYMKGIAFEDNDMTARLAQAFGGVYVDLSLTVTHQAHPQVAYSDNLEGWKINEAYTREKWGGIPWIDERVMRASQAIDVSVEETVREPVSV